MSNLRVGNPTRWGLEKLPLLKSWCPEHKQPEIWLTIQRMAPQVFPGAPPEVFMGFCANGERIDANTTESSPKQEFHEIGLWGTEAGLNTGPAPNKNPFAKYNSWGLLHNNVTVRKLLGDRDAIMTPDGWKSAVDDQCAIGLVNLQRTLMDLSHKIHQNLVPEDPASLWAIALAFMAWSAGVGGTASHLKRYQNALADEPESKRWGAFIREIVKAQPTGLKHVNPAYSAARTWQKITAGQILQDSGATGAAKCSTWFDAGLGSEDADLREQLAEIGYKEVLAQNKKNKKPKV